MSDDDPLTPSELMELLVLARALIDQLEKNRGLLKAQISGYEAVIWRAAWRKVICTDCWYQPAQTTWEDGTPLCFGCAYGRAGWEA